MNVRQYNEQTMKGLFRKVYPLIAGQMIARTGIRRGVCIDLGGGPGMLGICLAKASDLQARFQIRSATLNNWLGGRDALAFAPLDRQVKVART